MITKSTMATQNLDLIQQAIEEADKKMAGVALDKNDFANIRNETDHKLEELRADTVWIMESFRRLILTIEAKEEEIDRLHSEILAKNRIIFQVKKALGE